MSTGARREVYVIVIWKNGQSRLRSKFSPEPTDLAGSQSLHSSPSSGMAPGRGGRNGGRGTPDETVVMDGKTLRRVFDDSTKRWVYRPVDESSGDVISREDFESRRLAEANLRKANDPRHKAAEEKRWLDEQRGAIREKRADAARQARREDFNTAVRDGRVERNRKGRGKIVDVPEPKALTELREEMRLAQIQDTQKKNPGRFAFIKTALDLEESKYANVVEKKRREAYERERKKKGVFKVKPGITGLSQISDVNIQLCEVKIDKKKPRNKIVTSLNSIDYKNKSLVLVDDVLNSGTTLMYGVKHFLEVPLKRFKTAVLVNRNHKKYPIKADFKGVSLSTTLQDNITVKFTEKTAIAYLD